MKQNMRVLFFAPKQCWPPTTGAMLRNYHLARETARAAEVTFLSFTDETADAAATPGREANASKARETEEGVENPAHWCEEVISVPRGRGYTLGKLVRGAVGSTPVTVLNYTTVEMSRELARVLAARDFDLVQVESIHLAAYLPVIRAARNKPAALLDWHNVESEIMSRYAERAANAFRRAYALRTARQLASLEGRALREIDAHLSVSARDRERMQQLFASARVHVVENGVATNHFAGEKIERAYQSWLANGEGDAKPTGSNGGAANVATATRATSRRVVFVGSMDYHANVDAVVQFAREVWPRLSARLPGLVFTIVGRAPAPEVRELATLQGIEVTGTVEDVRPYYRNALAAVIPLRVGGGSRLKILEAMAAGVPVVSTRLGAEGIEVRDGADIMLAETADEFCDAVEELGANEERRREMVAAGRELVRARYDWSSIGAGLLKIYEELLGGKARPAM